MKQMKSHDQTYETIGWGILLILWGATILFDFIPFGIGVAGSGLILLGVNAVRSLNNLPTKKDNTVYGILMLAWGGLELGRSILRLIFASADLDWVIFAILLIGLGSTLLLRGLLRPGKVNIQKE